VTPQGYFYDRLFARNENANLAVRLGGAAMKKPPCLQGGFVELWRWAEISGR
jgi:hypothetical protein